MVIDNSRRKVIFIHIPKCGGVSVEDSIHKALGGDAVITRPKLINKPPRIDDDTCKGLFLHLLEILGEEWYPIGNIL